MKDYIFAVTNLVTFRDSLLTSNSKLVNINEDNIATLNINTTMIKYNGNQSVAIARIDDAQLAEIKSFDALVVVGNAKIDFINSNDDVNWIDENLYHAIHNIDEVTFIDGEGIEQSYTPAKLHAVFPELAADLLTKYREKGIDKRKKAGVEINGINVSLNKENQHGLADISVMIDKAVSLSINPFPLNAILESSDSEVRILIANQSEFDQLFLQFGLARQQYFL